MTVHVDWIGSVIVALAVLAHAWAPRIVGQPVTLSTIGWVVNILTMVALAACVVRC